MLNAIFSNMKTQFIYLGIAILMLVGACKVSAPIVGLQAGNLAPEISASKADNSIAKLSEMRGKLVLVEFWDSNNTGAKKNHFEIQRMYMKFKQTEFKEGTGFDIYSISIDSDKALWEKTVAAEGTTWATNVIDTKAWNAQPVLDYKIASLPKYFLINGKGEIINHNILTTDLEQILTKLKD